MPTNSKAPKFAEIKANPVTQAGIDRPERKKSLLDFIYFRSAWPMPKTAPT
jgi:hypothetical protein